MELDVDRLRKWSKVVENNMKEMNEKIEKLERNQSILIAIIKKTKGETK